MSTAIRRISLHTRLRAQKAPQILYTSRSYADRPSRAQPANASTQSKTTVKTTATLEVQNEQSSTGESTSTRALQVKEEQALVKEKDSSKEANEGLKGDERIYPIYTQPNELFDTYLTSSHARDSPVSTQGKRKEGPTQEFNVETTLINDPPLFMIEPRLRPTPRFPTRKYIAEKYRVDGVGSSGGDGKKTTREGRKGSVKTSQSRGSEGAAAEWGLENEEGEEEGIQTETPLDNALDQSAWNVADLKNDFEQWDRHATPVLHTSSLPSPAEAQTLPPAFLNTLMRFPLVTKRVVQQGGKGRMASWYVLTVAGNGEGLVGFGEGKDTENARAVEKSFIAACKDLDWVDRFEGRTLWNNIETKWGATRVMLRPRPLGFGLRCNPYIHQVCKAAGIKDISAKVHGSRNGMNIVKACLRVLRGGYAPPLMGDGVGGTGTRMDKFYGMRGSDSVERERGRRLAYNRLW